MPQPFHLFSCSQQVLLSKKDTTFINTIIHTMLNTALFHQGTQGGISYNLHKTVCLFNERLDENFKSQSSDDKR